ncbi:MAG TPA: ABC transporter permease [Pyrinomonadaceae bacterium]|nr:ABC transporter permease [Pyrinomonadaceae bacterium]
MYTLLQDLRYGLRMLRKSPGFAGIAILSLALGIGANTALFSSVDAVLLKTLPVKDPERLVLFNWQAGKPFRLTGTRGIFVGGLPPDRRGSSSFQGRLYEKMRDEVKAGQTPLTDLFAFANFWEQNALIDGQAELTKICGVSGGYFAGVGVPARLGRTLTDEDDNVSAPPAAMISHAYWQERFGADPSVVGKQIKLNQNTFTIVGVTPAGFNGTLQVDDRPAITIPIAFEPMLLGENSAVVRRDGKPGSWWLHVMGRMKPGATLEQARDSLNGSFQALALEMMPPPRKQNEKAQIETKDYPVLVALPGARGMWEMRKIYSRTIYLLFGVVGLVLLIACANVANLLLARSASRGGEITIRLAVGAGRRRLVRQLLTESLLLSALGGAVGVLFAFWGKEALSMLGSTRGSFLPPGDEYSLNWRVLGFTVGVSLITGIVFGLAPAWRATRADLTSALKTSTRGSSAITRSRLIKGLVVIQVAMSLVLLVGAGLFVRTLRNLEHVDVGFNQQNLLLFTLNPSIVGYKDQKLAQFYEQLLPRIDAIPGAHLATFGSVPLIAHYMNNTNLILPGETPESAAEHSTNIQVVRENYFATMEIPFIRGRGFSPQDNEKAPLVAIVSETLAKKFFPNDDAIGKRVTMDRTKKSIEIVGIVRDTKYNSQRDDTEPLFYTPWRQELENVGEMYFSVRVGGDPLSLVPAVREVVRTADVNLPVTRVSTQIQQTRETLTEERTFAGLVSFFGGLALLLAAIGLYGVMAYSVTQRRHEMGIRMALGARAIDVLRLVIRNGASLALVGIVLGLAGAFAATRLMKSLLFGVTATDVTTFVVVSILILLVAVLACYIPARRAAKVDPMEALRYE